jgi:MscS family membrane protein
MVEKPFRGGHWIKLADAEGIVERIGFRSTRIRTFGDSLISIPNSVIVNSIVDNLGVRGRRRQRFALRLLYGTDLQKVETFLERARELVVENPAVDTDEAHVHLHDLSEDGLEIQVYIHLRVSDFASEVAAREGLLLDLLRLAEELEVVHAYPTRTVHLTSP